MLSFHTNHESLDAGDWSTCQELMMQMEQQSFPLELYLDADVIREIREVSHCLPLSR